MLFEQQTVDTGNWVITYHCATRDYLTKIGNVKRVMKYWSGYSYALHIAAVLLIFCVCWTTNTFTF